MSPSSRAFAMGIFTAILSAYGGSIAVAQESQTDLSILTPSNDSDFPPNDTFIMTGDYPSAATVYINCVWNEVNSNDMDIPDTEHPLGTAGTDPNDPTKWRRSVTTANLPPGTSKRYRVTIKAFLDVNFTIPYGGAKSIFINVTASGSGGGE